jgi:predicted glutamine amidotransferase
MCRVFGCVASEPVSVRHELLDAENPMIRQSEEHDSGWGMATYRRADGETPVRVRFPQAAYADGDFLGVTDTRARIFNVHVRRATIGGLKPENTHPFALGNYTFSHNGTIIDFMKLLGPDVKSPVGDTDSEVLFNFLMYVFDPGDVVGSLRRGIAQVVERSPFSGLNFLFSDGELLYAYRMGIFELHWLARPGQLLVASERLTDEPWHTVQQDVLLVLDPESLDEVHAERLLGDELAARAEVRKLEGGQDLRGEERGSFAAERAARLRAGGSV